MNEQVKEKSALSELDEAIMNSAVVKRLTKEQKELQEAVNDPKTIQRLIVLGVACFGSAILGAYAAINMIS